MYKLRSLVFPSGKIHPLYKQYVGWSFISNIIVSTETAMATHSMLHAIDTDSEAVRTINYIGKDIIGQIGGLGYMAKMGKQADQYPVKFLWYSNIIQQSAYLAICLTPQIPQYFLPIAGCSNILTNISFTGFGAINAKCLQELALDDNIGEIYAKVSTLNTLGSSFGLLIGLAINIFIPDHNDRLFILPILAMIRVYTLNRAVSGIIYE